MKQGLITIVLGLLSTNAILCRAQWMKQSIVDMSYDFDENTIYWPGGNSFKLDEIFVGRTAEYW